jgi:predicted nucleotidyltransferase
VGGPEARDGARRDIVQVQPLTPPVTDDSRLGEVLRRLAAALHPERIYLFGSRARRDAGPDSDYDLMVIVSESTLTPYRRAGQAYRAIFGLGFPADVIVWTRDEFERRAHLPASFAATILREGKLVYAA